MIRDLGRQFTRFWFAPEPASTLAIVRFLYGAVVLAWTISLAPDTLAFYGTRGVLPSEPARDFRWGLFDLWSSDVMAIGVVAALLVASACLMVGYRARIASVLTFVLLLSLRDRNPWHLTGGDSLLRHFGFFLMFAPTGLALSVDRWRRARERFWRIPMWSPWPLRLMQLQLSAVYLFTVWSKGRGEQWWDGTAAGNVMHVDDLTRFAVPAFLRDSIPFSNIVTWGTLAVELAIAILIWNRRWRPFVIAGGIALHVFLGLTMQLGFFAATMFIGYATFIPSDTGMRWLTALRRWMSRSGRAPVRALAVAAPAVTGAAEDGSRVATPAGDRP